MMHAKPTKDRASATRFLTYEDACKFAHQHAKGHPAWRVIGHTDHFFIELLPEKLWLVVL